MQVIKDEYSSLKDLPIFCANFISKRHFPHLVLNLDYRMRYIEIKITGNISRFPKICVPIFRQAVSVLYIILYPTSVNGLHRRLNQKKACILAAHKVNQSLGHHYTTAVGQFSSFQRNPFLSYTCFSIESQWGSQYLHPTFHYSLGGGFYPFLLLHTDFPRSNSSNQVKRKSNGKEMDC